MSIFYSKNRQFINNKLQPVTAEETGRRMRILYGVRKVIRLLAPFHSNIQYAFNMQGKNSSCYKKNANKTKSAMC